MQQEYVEVQVQIFNSLLLTLSLIVKSRVLKRVYITEINFFPKGHSKETSNFPFIDNLEKAIKCF